MNRQTKDKIIVYARNTESGQDTQGAFRKPTSIRYVTDTRYLENIPKVQVCSRDGRYSRYPRYTAVPNFTVLVPWGSRYTVKVTVLHGTI